MQPQPAQNMIMSSNKKKKYPLQQAAPPPKQPKQPHQQQQQQQPTQVPTTFQMQKSFNVVAMLKGNPNASMTTSQQQQHQQQAHQQQQQTVAPPPQSYANVVNRTLLSVNSDLRHSANVGIYTNHNKNNPSSNNSSLVVVDVNAATAAAAAAAAGTQHLSTVASAYSEFNNGNASSGGVGGVTAGTTSGGLGGGNGGSNGGSLSMMTLTNSSGSATSAPATTLGVHLTAGVNTGGSGSGANANLLGLSVGGGGGGGGGGGCGGGGVGVIDSRKFDYKSTKLLSSNTYQAAQEYIPSTGANNSGQIRGNQTGGGGMYRGPPANSAQRNNTRQHMTMFQPTVQGVVLPSIHPSHISQYPRTPYQAAPQYAQYAQPIPQSFYPYPNYYPIAPQRGGVGVNTGVGLGTAMQPVPAGPNGSMAGPPGAAQPGQIPLTSGAVLTNPVPPGTSPGAVLGVSPSQSGQPVGVPIVVSTNVPAQRPAGPRSHRLQIIDPTTNRDILEDFDKTNKNSSSSSTTTDYQDQQQQQQMYSAPPSMSSLPSELSVNATPNEAANMGPVGTAGVIVMSNEPLRVLPYEVMDHSMPAPQRDAVVGQTPVVSAMSDAPSIEILPATQKSRSKKIPIVAPKDAISAQQKLPEPYEGKTRLFTQTPTTTTSATAPTPAATGTATTKPHYAEDSVKPDCVQQQQLPVTQMEAEFYPSQQVPPLSQQQQPQQQEPEQKETQPPATTTTTIAAKNPSDIAHSSSISSISKETDNQQQQSSNSNSNNSTNTLATSHSSTSDVVFSSVINNVNNLSSISSNSNSESSSALEQPAVSSTSAPTATITAVELSSAAAEMQLTTEKASHIGASAAVDAKQQQQQKQQTAGDSSSKNNNNNSDTVKAFEKEVNKLPNNNNNITLSCGKSDVAGKADKSHDQKEQPAAASSAETSLNSSSSIDSNRNNLKQVDLSASAANRAEVKTMNNNNANKAPVAAVVVPPMSTKLDSETVSNSSPSAETPVVSPTTATASTSPSTTSTTSSGTPGSVASATASAQSLINYNEGQWSPNNPTGKKQYDRKQLLQLREAKLSHTQPEVTNTSILPQPNLMPSFVRNPKRVQSTMGLSSSSRGSGPAGMDNAGGNAGGGGGGSGGGGQYVSKQASMSGRGSMKGGMIHVNLSLNQDVKLNETDNAWRPRVLVKGADADGGDPEARTRREKEELLRRVRGILNKLTPEKFDPLVEEIIQLKIDTPDKMEDVMILVFEKAIDEPNFSVMYARLCHRLITEVKARDERMESGTKSNLALFRSALLDKTEREFTQNVTKSQAKVMKLQPIIDKIAKCADPNEKAELELQLEEEERKIRRRSGGTVRFIGELFKISMLTGKIINSCIDALLNPSSEDMLECLCKLLTTVGAKFEQTPVYPKDPNSRCYSLDKVINRMQAISSKNDKEASKVTSRVRFMLQDVIDLRKNKWQSTRNEAPKTMEQIEKETKTEQMSTQYLNYSSSVSGSGGVGGGSNGPSSLSGGGKRGDDRSGGGRFNESRGGGGYGGSHSQRGESRRQQQGGGGGGSNTGGHMNANNDDNTWHVQTSKGGRILDTIKLEGLSTANQNFEPKKMGGLSQFQWSARQSAQPTTTLSNSFGLLSNLSDMRNSGGDRDRDRDRDRSGPRNKGSYNKGSMERDRGDRYGIHSRSGSSQASRENSSSRGPQGIRGAMNSGSSSMQKSASHSKYTQQQMPSTNRMPAKTSISTGPGLYPSARSMDLYSSNQQQQQKSQQSQLLPQQHQQQSESISSSVPAAAPPPAIFENSTSSEERIIKSVASELLEIATNSKTYNQQIDQCFQHVRDSQRCGFLYYLLTDYLYVKHVGKLQRRHLGNIVAYLIKNNHLSIEHVRLAYKKFCVDASDLAIDIPELWKYLIEFSGPLIARGLLTIDDLWNEELKETNKPEFGRQFLKIYLDYCLSEIGPSFTRTMWLKLNSKWIDFMPESEVNQFIQANKLEYLTNENVKAPIKVHEPVYEHKNKVVETVAQMLKEAATADCIIDYINGNIVDTDNDIDKKFVRNLTDILCNFAIDYKDGSYKLDTECFQKVCIPVLQRCIDSKEERELECLYTMQLLVHHLEHPRGLLGELFVELYDADVIPQDSFIKWRDSKDLQSAGKGVAVKALNSFFMQVLSSETSDENN